MSVVALRGQRAFDIKSTVVDLMSIVLRSIQPGEIADALHKKFAINNKSMLDTSFLLDASIAKTPESLDLAELLTIFKQNGLSIVALCHPDVNFEAIAKAQGLVFCQPRLHSLQAKSRVGWAMVVQHPVRTGQQIYAQNQDLIVLNIVNAGAEVAADGHIHIYAPLRGRALAGAKGDKNARIFVQSMEGELISIAGIYRTLDQELPGSMHHKTVQVHLEKDRLVMSVITI